MINWETLIGLAIAVLGSSVLTTLVNNYFQRKKSNAEAHEKEASAKKIEDEGDVVVLNAQHELLEKLLNKSQELVAQNEQLQKEYGKMLIENAQLRAEIVGHMATISKLQQDTKSMRSEIKQIMERVLQIDKHLELLGDLGNGSNSNPFSSESRA